MKIRSISFLMAACFLLSTAVVAGDIGTDARRYVRTYDCSFSKVQASGAACRDEGTCPTLSLVYYENISFVTNTKTTPLDPLTKQFPSSDRIDRTRVYTVSDVKCHANKEISILYWGGGNCRRVCEAAVRYKLSEDGHIIGKSLLEGRWSAIPAEKEYSVFDREKYTEWLDAK